MIKAPNTTCKICSKEFYKRPIDLKKDLNHYCSRNCQNQGRKTGKILKCTNCGIDFYRQNRECFENRNYFCSNSCSATYNNKNKTYGFTRSKLEIYIEEQLRIKYPELNIICNSKKEIGSELDFYFPDLKFAIELNGIVHYEPIYGMSKFEQIQNNDKLKFVNCHKNGIELAVIDTSSCGHLTVKSKSRYLNIIFELIEPLLQRLN